MPADKAAIGARLRASRDERGWSREALAARLRGVSEDEVPGVASLAHMIKEWEAGKHGVSDRYRVLYCRVLGMTGDDLFPTRPAESWQVAAGTVDRGTTPDIGDDDVKRRTAFQLIAALGVSAGTLGTEPFRHLMDLALTAEPRNLDDWHLACADHLHALRTRPAAQAREDLVIDLLTLGRQITTAEAGDLTELRRVQAALSMLHAHMFSRLGDHGAALRWWRTARSAADSSGDLDLRLMIRCEEAGVGLYGQRDVGTVLALIQNAERIAGDAPSFWKAELAGTQAKALTLLGQHDQALEALNTFVGYGGPDARASIFPTLWDPDQAHFAQSWVHAGAGDEAAADQARDLVLARRGDSQYAVNVRLHEALCTVVKGGTDRGMKQAAIILDTIPADYRTQMISYTGNAVLQAVPFDQQNRPTVREFREVLAKTAPKPALPAGKP